MKRLFLSGVALFATISIASAADLALRPHYTKAPVAVAPVYNWTGFYIGGFIGGAFSGSNGINNPVLAPTEVGLWEYGFADRGNHSSLFGGGQLGYNHQFARNWVIGIEGEIGGFDYRRGYASPIFGSFSQRSNWLASVAGRFGYTWGPGFIYVKGGAAFRDKGDFSTSYNFTPHNGYSIHGEDTGYAIGGGLEYMFAPRWSAKIEYLYYNFGRTDVYDSTNTLAAANGWIASYRDDLHTVKIGINYHFDWRGPVVARY